MNTLYDVFRFFNNYQNYKIYCYVCDELNCNPISFDEFLDRIKNDQPN